MEKSNHFSHPDHRLELKTFQKPYKCDGCKEPDFGKRYKCDLRDFDLHQDCMFFTQQTLQHFFHNSTFKFFDQPPPSRRSCGRNECNECKRHYEACGKPVTGFVYHCEEDDLDLHPCCLNLKSKLKIDGTEFGLCKGVDSSCFWYGKLKVRDSGRTCPSATATIFMCIVLRKWLSNCGKIETVLLLINNECLDLENLEIPRSRSLAKLRKNGGREHKYWKIMKVFSRQLHVFFWVIPPLL